MLFRRAAGFLSKSYFACRAGSLFPNPPSPSSSCLPGKLGSICTWMKGHDKVALWIMLSGPAAILLGMSGRPTLAEDKGYNSEEASLIELRRIEDGSVISNTHTSKWRIFTDNGRDLFLKGRLDEAEKYLTSALQEAKKGFGERDPHVASSSNNLAELYRVRKAFDKAEPLYLEALDILEESFGPEDIRVGVALHNLGQFYLVQKKLEEAQICYERALKIKARVLGYGHSDYADTMYHLGMVLHLQGKEKDAEALIRDSIRILEECGLGESMTCVKRMRYLSQILINSNRPSEAGNLQRKVLHALELSKGWESLDTVIAAESLALTLQSIGNLRESQELLERCLDVRTKILHEDHIQVAANMLHLARLSMLNSGRLMKASISEAIAEIDKAKHLLDNSIRITRQILDGGNGSKSTMQNVRKEKENSRDEHAALIILLQSLDVLGTVEITRHELHEPTEAHVIPHEAERAFEQCILVVKEHAAKNLLNSSAVKAEYLSCLKHLVCLLRTGANEKQSRARVKELQDEINSLEVELLPKRKHRIF